MCESSSSIILRARQPGRGVRQAGVGGEGQETRLSRQLRIRDLFSSMPKARKRQRTEPAVLGDVSTRFLDDKDDEELALEEAIFGAAPAHKSRKADENDNDGVLEELNDNDVSSKCRIVITSNMSAVAVFRRRRGRRGWADTASSAAAKGVQKGGLGRRR